MTLPGIDPVTILADLADVRLRGMAAALAAEQAAHRLTQHDRDAWRRRCEAAEEDVRRLRDRVT